ncbi:MAG TPA: hypothetical protein ENO00_09865 [Deltaproteobacteria bacterium]|nr:hypothetical protein [Deltaproteobacteria bacterium]
MKPSGIITMTTDFGVRDPYVAMIKGVILSVNPEASIVDVTHDIPPGAILQAANTIEAFHFSPMEPFTWRSLIPASEVNAYQLP